MNPFTDQSLYTVIGLAAWGVIACMVIIGAVRVTLWLMDRPPPID